MPDSTSRRPEVRRHAVSKPHTLLYEVSLLELRTSRNLLRQPEPIAPDPSARRIKHRLGTAQTGLAYLLRAESSDTT